MALQPVPITPVHVEALSGPIQALCARLDNWADCWRVKLRFMRREYAGQTLENHYRSRGALHWDYDEVVGTAPRVRIGVDPLDAAQVELGVTALDVYHHVILKGHYIRMWPGERTVRVARTASSLGNPRKRGDIDASLAMARALLMSLLDHPATLRKARAAKAAAAALELPMWGDDGGN